MTPASDISPFTISGQGLGQPLTLSDPAAHLGIPTGGPVGPSNHRKRRASGQPPLNYAPPPSTLAQYGHPLGVPMSMGESLVEPLEPLVEPASKKGRTNTPWTPDEEQRLKQMRDLNKTWSEIAKTFPNRTEGSVKKHWYKVSY
jgi:hypothetical protein